MYLPKKDVYNSLKELPCFVAQSKPAVFNELPAVIFGVGNNAVIADLDGEISSQDVEIQIDIWAEDSSTASAVLSQVEGIMRSNLYIMSFSNDVPNIGDLRHIACRFTRKV